MIYPEIFDGVAMGFFTDRETGIDVEAVAGRTVYLPIQKHTDKVTVVEEDLVAEEVVISVVGNIKDTELQRDRQSLAWRMRLHTVILKLTKLFH